MHATELHAQDAVSLKPAVLVMVLPVAVLGGEQLRCSCMQQCHDSHRCIVLAPTFLVIVVPVAVLGGGGLGVVLAGAGALPAGCT